MLTTITRAIMQCVFTYIHYIINGRSFFVQKSVSLQPIPFLPTSLVSYWAKLQQNWYKFWNKLREIVVETRMIILYPLSWLKDKNLIFAALTAILKWPLPPKPHFSTQELLRWIFHCPLLRWIFNAFSFSEVNIPLSIVELNIQLLVLYWHEYFVPFPLLRWIFSALSFLRSIFSPLSLSLLVLLSHRVWGLIHSNFNLYFSGSHRRSTTRLVRWTLSISPSTSRPVSWNLEAGHMMGFRWARNWGKFGNHIVENHIVENVIGNFLWNISSCEMFHLVSCVLIAPSLWCTGVSLSPTSELTSKNLFPTTSSLIKRGNGVLQFSRFFV